MRSLVMILFMLAIIAGLCREIIALKGEVRDLQLIEVECEGSLYPGTARGMRGCFKSTAYKE